MWSKSGFVRIEDPELAFAKMELDLAKSGIPPTTLDMLPSRRVEIYHEMILQESLRQQSEMESQKRGMK